MSTAVSEVVGSGSAIRPDFEVAGFGGIGLGVALRKAGDKSSATETATALSAMEA